MQTCPGPHAGPFCEAYLIVEVEKVGGESGYIALEASYTCNSRETDRAAWPVVAGVRVDRRIQPLIDVGDVHFFQLEDRGVRPDEPE